MTNDRYRVRGPDPDGDYFIVELIDGEEYTLDETFLSEDAAQAVIARLVANDQATNPKL
jgi:hypothetical protein